MNKILCSLALIFSSSVALADNFTDLRELLALSPIVETVKKQQPMIYDIKLDSKGQCNEGAKSLLKFLSKNNIGKVPTIKNYIFSVKSSGEERVSISGDLLFINSGCESSFNDVSRQLNEIFNELSDVDNKLWQDSLSSTLKEMGLR